MSAELQAEIVAVAAALVDTKQARIEKSALADSEAALKEREESFGRDAVSHFVVTDQIEYHGGACPDSSEGEIKNGANSGAEGGAGYAEAIGGLMRAGEFVDSWNKDRNDEKGSSLGSFIDDGGVDSIDENRIDVDFYSAASASGRLR